MMAKNPWPPDIGFSEQIEKRIIMSEFQKYMQIELLALSERIKSQLAMSDNAKPHGSRNGVPDSTGGYALKHEWL